MDGAEQQPGRQVHATGEVDPGVVSGAPLVGKSPVPRRVPTQAYLLCERASVIILALCADAAAAPCNCMVLVYRRQTHDESKSESIEQDRRSL